MIRNDVMLTLANDHKYIVLENIPYDSVQYLHLVKVNNEGKEVLDEFKVAKVIKENDKTFIEIISDEEELDIILPLLKMSYYRRHKSLKEAM